MAASPLGFGFSTLGALPVHSSAGSRAPGARTEAVDSRRPLRQANAPSKERGDTLVCASVSCMINVNQLLQLSFRRARSRSQITVAHQDDHGWGASSPAAITFTRAHTLDTRPCTFFRRVHTLPLERTPMSRTAPMC